MTGGATRSEDPAEVLCWPTAGYRKAFVVGCARSGTTWVRGLLARHPSVWTGKESHLFPVLLPPLLSRGSETDRNGAVLAAFDEMAENGPSPATVGPHHWISRSALSELLDEVTGQRLGRDQAARLVLEGVLGSYYAVNGGGADGVLVEKTPRHLHHAARILDWWADARVIEVVRDGRDVCVSLEHKSRAVSWAPAEREVQMRKWVEAVRLGSRFREDDSLRDRWCLVRYEDLAADGVREVARLFDFLGLSAEPEQIEDIVSSSSIENVRRPGDAHHIRRGEVGGWRDHLTKSERRAFSQLAGDELRTLGYQV